MAPTDTQPTAPARTEGSAWLAVVALAVLGLLIGLRRFGVPHRS
jgi:MYXO-CTERM domain-containing protein